MSYISKRERQRADDEDTLMRGVRQMFDKPDEIEEEF